MIYILFYLPNSDLSEFVLYWQDGQCVCVCVLATVESFALENVVNPFLTGLRSRFRRRDLGIQVCRVITAALLCGVAAVFWSSACPYPKEFRSGL